MIKLNESASPKTAEFVLNAELGDFSMALGMSQKLSNGNYHFTSGCILKKFSDIADFMAKAMGKSIEVIPHPDTGTWNYIQLATKGSTYRSFRLQSLYEWPVYYEVLYVNKNDGTCGGKSPCYTSIQSAIDAAGTGSAIRIAQGTYNESIALNSSKWLTLKGGWNSAFTSQTPNTTVIKAPKAAQGSLKLQVVTIRP